MEAICIRGYTNRYLNNHSFVHVALENGIWFYLTCCLYGRGVVSVLEDLLICDGVVLIETVEVDRLITAIMVHR